MVAGVGLVHGQTHHLIAGLGAVLVGVHIEHARPLAVQGTGNVEGGRAVSCRLCHALDDELSLRNVIRCRLIPKKTRVDWA